VLAGLAVVVLVGNDHGVQLALVFAFMFGAMYFFRTVYGLMVFFITALLALLYKILGNFSTALLLTRLIETAVGSAIGVLVATFVLPTSTREALGTSVVGFLRRLATVIEDSERRMTQPGDVPDPTVDARELDRALADLFARAQPATAAWPLPSSRSGVRQRLLVANRALATPATSRVARDDRMPRFPTRWHGSSAPSQMRSRRMSGAEPTRLPERMRRREARLLYASTNSIARAMRRTRLHFPRSRQQPGNFATLTVRSRNSATRRRAHVVYANPRAAAIAAWGSAPASRTTPRTPISRSAASTACSRAATAV